MNFRSPLSRVIGHGAARDGAHHWWVERVTGAALLPLGAWFLLALVALHGSGGLADSARVHAWLATPWNAILMLLFINTSAWHSRLGVQVVIEDYVHGAAARLVSLLASAALHVLAALAASFAVVYVALGR